MNMIKPLVIAAISLSSSGIFASDDLSNFTNQELLDEISLRLGNGTSVPSQAAVSFSCNSSVLNIETITDSGGTQNLSIENVVYIHDFCTRQRDKLDELSYVDDLKKIRVCTLEFLTPNYFIIKTRDFVLQSNGSIVPFSENGTPFTAGSDTTILQENIDACIDTESGIIE